MYTRYSSARRTYTERFRTIESRFAERRIRDTISHRPSAAAGGRWASGTARSISRLRRSITSSGSTVPTRGRASSPRRTAIAIWSRRAKVDEPLIRKSILQAPGGSRIRPRPRYCGSEEYYGCFRRRYDRIYRNRFFHIF